MARRRRTKSDEELVQRVLEGSRKGREAVKRAFAKAKAAKGGSGGERSEEERD